jgi:glucose dehydrogenase
MSITVATTDQGQNFVLDRVVSQLVVIIKDAIPSSVKTIGLTASNQPFKFLIGSGTVAPPTTSSGSTMHFIDTVASSDIGKTNYQVSTMFLSYQPFTLTVGASSSIIFNGEIVAQKSATVTGAPNTQTILSGYLFGGSGGGGLTVKIDTSWNSTPIIKTFP